MGGLVALIQFISTRAPSAECRPEGNHHPRLLSGPVFFTTTRELHHKAISIPTNLAVLNEHRLRTCDAVSPLRRVDSILSVKLLA